MKQGHPNNGHILNKQRRKHIKEGPYAKVSATLCPASGNGGLCDHFGHGSVVLFGATDEGVGEGRPDLHAPMLLGKVGITVDCSLDIALRLEVWVCMLDLLVLTLEYCF